MDEDKDPFLADDDADKDPIEEDVADLGDDADDAMWDDIEE